MKLHQRETTKLINVYCHTYLHVGRELVKEDYKQPCKECHELRDRRKEQIEHTTGNITEHNLVKVRKTQACKQRWTKITKPAKEKTQSDVSHQNVVRFFEPIMSEECGT